MWLIKYTVRQFESTVNDVAFGSRRMQRVKRRTTRKAVLISCSRPWRSTSCVNIGWNAMRFWLV